MGKPRAKPTLANRKRWKKMKTQRTSALRKTELIVKWSTKEKRKILDCFRRFGCDDLQKLESEMRTKTKEQIGYFIERRRHFAKRKQADETTCDPPPIDTWIDRSRKAMAQKCDYSGALIEALSTISAKESNDSKYEEVYSYLQCLLRNEVTADLSSQASEIIVQLLSDLATFLHLLPLKTIQRWITYDISPPDALLELRGVQSERFYHDGQLNNIGPSFNPLKTAPAILQYVFERAINAI